MCLGSEDTAKTKDLFESTINNLQPRKCPPNFSRMLWTPLEYLLMGTTAGVGIAAVALATPLELGLPRPGTMAAVFQGVILLLHGWLEGPRLQLLPLYISGAITAAMAGLDLPVGVIVGAFTLVLASSSALLCYQMPKLLPVGGRGPFAVGIATEHIRTPCPEMETFDEELWPLELMAQVFYPVEPLCVEKLPWFPYTLRLSRRSLVPVWGCGRHVPFGLTQAGLVGAGVVLAAGASRLPGSTLLPETLLRSSVVSISASAKCWLLAAAFALCSTCLLSDLRQGASRSGYKARYIGVEQAKRIARFVKMPGWITAHLSRFDGPGFDAGYFHGPDVPCFPVAPLQPGERKRPVVIFFHGLGGNRAVYSEHGAEMASHGYVAIFLEHNDGSGSSCSFPDGRVTGYATAPDLSSVSSPANRGFRLAQLRRRGRELKLSLAHLSKLEHGYPTDLEMSRRVGLADVIDTKRPALVGHSFGGATILQVLHDNLKSSGSKAKDLFSMAFVMDAWTFPISDEALEQSINIPLVVVTTDTFLGVEGVAREARLVDNTACAVREGENDLVLQIRIKDSAHNNFSDVALFAPGAMRQLKNAGSIDGVTFQDQVARLLLCSLEVFHRRRTESGDADGTSPPSDLASVVLGSDLPAVFPEARVKRLCAGRVLPSRDYS